MATVGTETHAPKVDAPKVDAVKPEAPKVDAPKVDAPKVSSPPAASAPAKPTEVSKVSVSVEVTPAEDFKCKYSGNWYEFKKGKKQSVPRTMFEESLKGSGKLQMTF